MEHGHRAGDLRERQAVQLLGHRVRRRDHVVQLEVRLELVRVEVVLRLADLLGVVEVVPRLDGDRLAFLGGDRLHVGDLLLDARDRGRPHAHHQLRGLLRIAGHRVVHAPVRVRREAEQLGAIGAQLDDPGDDRVGVVGVAVVAAALERLPHLLAQVAARRKREERIDGRAGVDDGPLAGELALVGGGLVGRDECRRQAGEIGLAVEHDPGVLVGEHLVGEVRERAGELLVDLRELLLLRGTQLGALPHEAVVGPLREPLLLGREAGGRHRVPDRRDAGEQPLVERDLVVSGSEDRRQLAVERLVLRCVEVAGHDTEQHVQPSERAARTLQGLDRVGERGRRRVFVIASISLRWRSIAARNAGLKSSGDTLSHGGTPP